MAFDPEERPMTIDEALLKDLTHWRPSGACSGLTMDHAVSGWQVNLSAERIDAIGCLLRDLTVSPLRPLLPRPPLAKQAGRIASRVTGLLESLRLVEVDESQDIAQLRSATPARCGADLFYYEVVCHAEGTTRVGRYQVPATGKRHPIPFTLTHEGLAKLVSDLTVC